MSYFPSVEREPTQLGHYQILTRLGQGGMGIVYLALDQKLGRRVAIKCLRNELFEQNYRQRFKREALLLAKLNHPHIVQIYDFIDDDDRLALVMEYVDGRNLQQHMHEHRVLIVKRMQWLTQIAQGLAVAHDAGIIHRDLKAENILISKRGDAKISDLGIAKSQEYNATVTDYIAGSYASMSPEQAMGEALGFKSDLFSFGILSYQLLCGTHPFGDTNNKLQLMQRIISHPPISPIKNNPNLPSDMCNLLGALLAKNCDKRPDNTHWVAEQFAELTKAVVHSQLDTHSSPERNDIDNTLALTDTPKKTHTTDKKKYYLQSIDTFDTDVNRPRAAVRLFLWLGDIISAHKMAAGFIGLIVCISIAAAVLQLQPKQPRYIAVVPPILSTQSMQESQQDLVKGTVFDAIKHSVLQLNDYYLIPQDQVSDITGDNDSIRKATGADEIITTSIQCKVESCSITFSRLVPEKDHLESRLRVKDTKTVDVLTDNYVSVADIVQTNIGQIYATKLVNTLDGVDEKDYAIFLDIHTNYLKKGASQEQLSALDHLQNRIRNLPALQTLYKDITLDLFFESKNSQYLTKLEDNLRLSQDKSSATYLSNLFYWQIAKENFEGAKKTTEQLKQLNASHSAIYELYAYSSVAMQDYQGAIGFYKKALESKVTFTTLLNIANAYWYAGNTAAAKKYLQEAITLSPQQKAFSLYGLVYLTEGDIANATGAFESAIAKRPDDASNLDNLGICYMLEKKYTEAIAAFEKASVLSPNNTAMQLNKADVLNLAGNRLASDKLYRDIISSLKREEMTSSHLRHLAQAHAHLGNYAEALTALQRLEKMDPQNTFTTYTAALVHTLANNNASALLNAGNSVNNGLNAIWFSFLWFDPLCKSEQFVQLMKNHNAPNRCSIQ